MLRRRCRLWVSLAVTSLVFLSTCIVVLAWPIDADRYLTFPVSGELLDRAGRPMHAYLARDDQWCFERDLDSISPRLIKATIAAEDQRFYAHHGVDLIAIGRAVLQNARRGRQFSGASTLTMQVVKRARGGPRNAWTKACEAVLAVRLERASSKDEILRTYLNTAPYGLNLTGCEAAARRYFSKSAAELTLAEAALLAGLPKAPGLLMPLRNPKQATGRRDYVLKRMLDEGFISASDYDEARAQALTARWHEFPDTAPHLARRLSNEAHGRRLVTTLDQSIQENCIRLIARSLKSHGNEIGNAAAIVLDAPTASVLAYVGSADFYEDGGGQVDLLRAPRSPGSALKPFVYALAIEENCLYPSEMLWDHTLDYGLYNPENFDGLFRGLVSATEALRLSLNVPAVTVLDRITVPRAHRLLRELGLTTVTATPEYYGLGLTLGNCEARVEEVAAAYAALANLGQYQPLRFIADSPAPAARPVLSRGTCRSLYEMLEQPFPNEFDRSQLAVTDTAANVCWKTGTSTGRRDAWGIAFNTRYVVGVWMGNNDGSGSPRLIGVSSALPLAAAIFRSLPTPQTSAWPTSDGLRPIKTCTVSGLPATEWCPHAKTTTISETQYLNRWCTLHSPQRDAESNALHIVERWPGSAKGWDLAKIDGPVFTRLVGEPVAPARKALAILAPTNEAEYVLTREPNADRIKLRSSLDDEAALHWYLDGTYLGQSAPQAPLFVDLTAGSHLLSCMSPEGGLDKVQFSVLTGDSAIRFEE